MDEQIAVTLFAEVFEESPDATLIMGPDGNILHVNKKMEFMFGFHRSQLVGQPVEILVSPEIREQHIKDREKYLLDPRMRSMGLGMILKGLHKSNAQVNVEIELSPISTPQGICTIARVTRKR